MEPSPSNSPRGPIPTRCCRGHDRPGIPAKDDGLARGTAPAKAEFKHATAATNLRALLDDCDAQAVAALAERLR